jgi:GNAT superfamily N-acetyltransferase
MTQHVAVSLGRPSIRVRPIAPADVDVVRAFYAALSDDSRRRRFLSAATAVDAAEATYFCGPDHAHREGFIALADTGHGEEVVGHLCVEPAGPHAAEIAVAVADKLQGRGIGRRLTNEAVRWARRHSVDRFEATCAVDNAGILGLFRGLGRPIRFGPLSGGAMEVAIDLGTRPAHHVVAA